MHNKTKTGKLQPNRKPKVVQALTCSQFKAKVKATIERVKQNLQACDDDRSPVLLPWHEDTTQARGAYAQKLVKEVRDYCDYFHKQPQAQREQLLAQLRPRSFDAQFRKLRTLSRSKKSLTQTSDGLIFRWVKNPPPAFAAWMLAAVPDVSRFARRLPIEQRQVLVASLEALKSRTEQALTLISLAGSKVNLLYIADHYERQFKPAHKQALREVNKRRRGTDILRKYCKDQPQETCNHLSAIVTQLMDLRSGRPLRELLQKQHATNPSRLRQFLNDALCVIAYAPKATPVEDLAAAVVQLAADRAPKDSAAKADFAAIARGLRMTPVLLTPLLREIRKSPARLLAFVGEVLTRAADFAKGTVGQEDLLQSAAWPELDLHKDAEIPDLLAPHTGKPLLRTLTTGLARKEVERLAKRRHRGLSIKRA